MIVSHDLVHSIEFQMSLLLFMALSGYLLANIIRQPAVIGVIFVGILIGPSGFNIINFSEFVASAGNIGAIILLFAIGLESRIRTAAKPSCSMIALGGIILPWAGGYLVAILFGFEFTKAIIIGVALTATSLAITADTLRELGKLQSGPAQAIIGAAIIDDILALLALTISQQLSSGSVDTVLILVYTVKAAVFVLAGVWFGRKVLAPLMRHIDRSPLADKYPDFVFILSIVLAFFYAMIAALIGLSAIIGAFLAGMSLARVTTKHCKDFREGTEFLRIIFGAIFFISLGILIDLRDFTWDMAGFVLTLTIVAILSKVIGCGVMAKLCGMGKHDALIIGVGMSPRGETAMAISLLAFTNGLIDQSTFVALVLTSLLTTVIAPILLRNWLYKGDTIDDKASIQDKRPRAH